MAVDQLRYTAAKSGLHGHGGFQVVAASRQLASRQAALTQQALRLCTYHLPAGADSAHAPISFGWRDQGTMRFAFRRVYTGADPWGRPGNFAAHILVGRRSDMPLPILARTYHAAFWWQGELELLGPEEERARMPKIDLTSLAPQSVSEPPAELLVHALAALLATDRNVTVMIRADAGDAASILTRVAAIVPERLEGCAVSAYEQPSYASAFRLVGVGGGTPRVGGGVVVEEGVPPHVDARILELARDLTTPDRATQRVAAAALAAARRHDGNADVAELLHGMAALSGLGTTTRPSDVQEIMGVPEVRSYLDERAPGRTLVVEAALSGIPAAWSAFISHIREHGVTSGYTTALGRELREQVHSGASHEQIAQRLSVLVEGTSPEESARIVLAAMSARGAVASWPIDEQIDVFVHLIRRLPAHHRLRMLATLARDRRFARNERIERDAAETVALQVLGRVERGETPFLDVSEATLVARLRGPGVDVLRGLGRPIELRNKDSVVDVTREALERIQTLDPDYPLTRQTGQADLIERLLDPTHDLTVLHLLEATKALHLCAESSNDLVGHVETAIVLAARGPEHRLARRGVTALAYILTSLEREDLYVRGARITEATIQRDAESIAARLGPFERALLHRLALACPAHGEAWEKRLWATPRAHRRTLGLR